MKDSDDDASYPDWRRAVGSHIRGYLSGMMDFASLIMSGLRSHVIDLLKTITSGKVLGFSFIISHPEYLTADQCQMDDKHLPTLSLDHRSSFPIISPAQDHDLFCITSPSREQALVLVPQANIKDLMLYNVLLLSHGVDTSSEGKTWSHPSKGLVGYFTSGIDCS